jgi:hypothetical protein
MRLPFLISLVFAAAAFVVAANPTPEVQQGKFSEVRLISVSRLQPKKADAAPDGLTFHFVVARQPDAGPLALKETRDFLVGGQSYQAKTKAELGQQFEPGTEVNDAGKFFAKNPKLAPPDAKAGKVLVISVSIGGAKLTAGAAVEATLHVGAGKQIEAFTFGSAVPAP